MGHFHRYWLALPTVIAIVGTAAAAPTTLAPATSPRAQPPGLQLAQSSTTTTTTTYQLIAPSAPPALRAEVIPPPPPSTTVTWEPGHWNWANAQWVWIGGHYAERPSTQAVWEPGHWSQQANGWLWIDGRWRMAAN